MRGEAKISADIFHGFTREHALHSRRFELPSVMLWGTRPRAGLPARRSFPNPVMEDVTGGIPQHTDRPRKRPDLTIRRNRSLTLLRVYMILMRSPNGTENNPKPLWAHSPRSRHENKHIQTKG